MCWSSTTTRGMRESQGRFPNAGPPISKALSDAAVCQADLKRGDGTRLTTAVEEHRWQLSASVFGGSRRASHNSSPWCDSISRPVNEPLSRYLGGAHGRADACRRPARQRVCRHLADDPGRLVRLRAPSHRQRRGCARHRAGCLRRRLARGATREPAVRPPGPYGGRRRSNTPLALP
jgi:hypothetical protein